MTAIAFHFALSLKEASQTNHSFWAFARALSPAPFKIAIWQSRVTEWSPKNKKRKSFRLRKEKSAVLDDTALLLTIK